MNVSEMSCIGVDGSPKTGRHYPGAGLCLRHTYPNYWHRIPTVVVWISLQIEVLVLRKTKREMSQLALYRNCVFAIVAYP